MDLSIGIKSNRKSYSGSGNKFQCRYQKFRKKALKNSEKFYGAASLGSNNDNPVKFIQSFLLELEKIFETLNQGKIIPIIKAWTKRSSNIGKITTISTLDGKIRGKATKLDNDGALVISQKGHNRRILVGDVV